MVCYKTLQAMYESEDVLEVQISFVPCHQRRVNIPYLHVNLESRPIIEAVEVGNPPFPPVHDGQDPMIPIDVNRKYPDVLVPKLSRPFAGSPQAFIASSTVSRRNETRENDRVSMCSGSPEVSQDYLCPKINAVVVEPCIGLVEAEQCSTGDRKSVGITGRGIDDA